MYLRTLQILFLVMLVPAIFAACGMKKAPDDEQEEKKGKPRTGAQVYQTSSLGGEVYSLADSDATIRTSIVPSLSVYDYMDRVKEALGRESKINVDEECFGIGAIGQTNPRALEIDIVVDQDCAKLPEGEPSHTDPAQDDFNSWVICEPSDSGNVEDGPGADPAGGGPGGEAPTGESGDEGGSDQTAALGNLQSILCGPAVFTQPGGVDPRLVYPDPDKAHMIAELAPCILSFCPWKLTPIPLDPEDDPTDPVDPNPEDDVELPDEIKEKLPCDKFKGLCEPDITLITKNDLVKEDDDDDDITETDEWKECDGKNNDGSNRVENCEVGDVGNETADWKECGFFEGGSSGSIYACVEHKKDPNTEEGESEYTVTINPNLDESPLTGSDQTDKAEGKSEFIVTQQYESQSNCTAGDQTTKGGSISTGVDCD